VARRGGVLAQGADLGSLLVPARFPERPRSDARGYSLSSRTSEAEAPFRFTKELKLSRGFCMIQGNDPAGSRTRRYDIRKDSRDERSPALRIEKRACAITIRVFCSRLCSRRTGVSSERRATASNVAQSADPRIRSRPRLCVHKVRAPGHFAHSNRLRCWQS
jgi:hypothetical protein